MNDLSFPWQEQKQGSTALTFVAVLACEKQGAPEIQKNKSNIGAPRNRKRISQVVVPIFWLGHNAIGKQEARNLEERKGKRARTQHLGSIIKFDMEN